MRRIPLLFLLPLLLICGCRKNQVEMPNPIVESSFEEIQQKLDAGNEFGDRAMGIFGEYEEMTVYRPGTQIPDKKAMASRTAEHLEKGTAGSVRRRSSITITIALLIF